MRAIPRAGSSARRGVAPRAHPGRDTGIHGPDLPAVRDSPGRLTAPVGSPPVDSLRPAGVFLIDGDPSSRYNYQYDNEAPIHNPRCRQAARLPSGHRCAGGESGADRHQDRPRLAVFAHRIRGNLLENPRFARQSAVFGKKRQVVTVSQITVYDWLEIILEIFAVFLTIPIASIRIIE